jgi:putative transposase
LKTLFANVRPFYFVTFNTRNRIPILAQSTVHESFIDFSRRGQEKGVAVGRYVIMPDHIHMFVVTPEAGTTLGRWVGALKMALGRALIGMGHSKPHWQDGFFDHVMRNADSYSEKWDYVRMNPIRKGLCEKPEDWPFQGEIAVLRF